MFLTRLNKAVLSWVLLAGGVSNGAPVRQIILDTD
jgi:hypothetical protein